MIPAKTLYEFSKSCLLKVGTSKEDATIVADVLNVADLTGKESHGVARLRRYVDGVAKGKINGNASLNTIHDFPGTALLDAENGLGQPAAAKAMEMAISKAKVCGIAMVGVQHTNHFSIAGYYSRLAAQKKMIGISISNASPQVAPTFGAEAMFGTNPLAVALPGKTSPIYSLDMATSVVPRGKLERMSWYGESMPENWGITPESKPATDIHLLIEGLKKTAGYALLPLGGGGELFSGHKGYGLGILMDLLCGPLLGSDWGKNTYTNGTANLGQLFIAINVECFMSLETFFENTECLLDELRSSKILPDQDRIFIPGEKSVEKAKQRQVEGVPVLTKVYENLQALSKEYQVELGDFPSE